MDWSFYSYTNQLFTKAAYDIFHDILLQMKLKEFVENKNDSWPHEHVLQEVLAFTARTIRNWRSEELLKIETRKGLVRQVQWMSSSGQEDSTASSLHSLWSSCFTPGCLQGCPECTIYKGCIRSSSRTGIVILRVRKLQRPLSEFAWQGYWVSITITAEANIWIHLFVPIQNSYLPKQHMIFFMIFYYKWSWKNLWRTQMTHAHMSTYCKKR